ncbi:MAG: hypothetical protein ACRBFS_00965 [Aureispira sp.]
MGIERLLVDITLKAAAGQLGKKISDAIVTYPFVENLKKLLPAKDQEEVDKLKEEEVSQEDIDLIRKHITNTVHTTKDFKVLVRDAFDLSGADVQLLMQYFEGLNNNVVKHKKLLKQYKQAGVAMQGDYENMIEQTQEKIAYHEAQALGILKGEE